MSRNIAEHQLDRSFVNTLNSLGRHQTASRSLQLQGSEALELLTVWGVVVLDIADSSITTDTSYITVTSTNPEVTCIATLTSSLFIEYPVSAGEVVNADLENHGLSDDTWKRWMTYDRRQDFDQTLSVPYSPSGTLPTRLLAAMTDTAIEPYQASFGFNFSRLSSATRPAEVGQFAFMLFESRILIG